MAKVVLVLGESGSGKSSSIEGLPPEQTFIVAPEYKELPFEGSDEAYPRISYTKLLNGTNTKGRFLVTDKLGEAAKSLVYVSKNRPEVKYAIVEDNQFYSLFTFISRINDRDGFAKFNDIAVNLVEFTRLLKGLREDMIIFLLHHIETGEDVRGNDVIQAKTMGKFVKEKVTFESLFTNVLLCDKEVGDASDEINHFFWTRMAGSTVKTPKGMFTDQKIPNDLRIVGERMREYYKMK